jgi:hypothetical protein
VDSNPVNSLADSSGGRRKSDGEGVLNTASTVATAKAVVRVEARDRSVQNAVISLLVALMTAIALQIPTIVAALVKYYLPHTP